MPLTRHAHAKLNLLLSVGAPLPPDHPRAGHHPILSWMHCIDLADTVTVERLPAGAPSTHSIRWASDAPRPTPIDWPLEIDLALRAHRALEALVNQPLPAAIQLEKRIPVGAGLGGGSSDAAATILTLRDAFSLALTDADLTSLCASLGADVPFFADPHSSPPRPAFVGGLGEKIERLSPLAAQVILVIPPFSCPTGPVYKAFDQVLEEHAARERRDRAIRGLTGPEKSTAPRDQLVRGRAERMMKAAALDADSLMNDLAIPAFRVEPRLGALVTALSNAARTRAHVTGSGSCVFLTPAPGKAPRLLERATRVLTTLAQSDPAWSPATALITRLT